MRLPWWARARAAVSRVIARWLLGHRWTRKLLAAARSAPVAGQVLDSELAAMLRLDDLSGESDLRGLSPRAARRQVATSVRACEPESPRDVEVTALSIPSPAGPLNLPSGLAAASAPRSLALSARLYQPPGLSAPSVALFYVHGGGFVTGDLDTHDSACRLFAKLIPARVISVDYRLAPEHPFPAAVDDVVTAFRWMAEHAAELGIDATRIAVSGDSAGGNLSAVLAQRTRGDALRPRLHAPMYPAFDARCGHPSNTTYAKGWMLTAPMIEWYYRHYVPEGVARSDPGVSPLLTEELSDVPETIVYTSGFDPLRDEGAAYVERLKQAGVRARLVCFENLIHGFALLGGMSRACLEATQRVARDIGEVLRSA